MIGILEKRVGQAMDEKQRIMKTGIFPTENEASIFLIAQIISKTGAPVGAWSLKEELKKVGIYCGTATVGRYLKELDYKGLTAQKSNKGRVLTDYGQQWLNKLSDDVARALVHTESTQAMRVDHYSQLVDLIQARKVLEVAAARLAAERATKEDLLLLQQVVMTHYRYVAENKAYTGNHLFCVCHVAVSRLHGRVAYMDGMDGKNTILTCSAGLECRCRGSTRCADTAFRSHLLLRHLPAGCHAGYCFVGRQSA